MDAKELRIGNYVQEPDGTLWRITAIMDKRVLISDNNDNETGFNLYRVQPIPLTADLLEKIGFKRLPADENNTTFDHWEFNGDSFLWEHDEGFCINALNDRDIHSLHELQNLYFALTGEELTVNLSK